MSVNKTAMMVKSMGLTLDQYTQLYAMTFKYPIDIDIKNISEDKLRAAVFKRYGAKKPSAYGKLFAILDSMGSDIRIMIILAHGKVFVITQWDKNTAVTTLDRDALPANFIPNSSVYAAEYEIKMEKKK